MLFDTIWTGISYLLFTVTHSDHSPAFAMSTLFCPAVSDAEIRKGARLKRQTCYVATPIISDVQWLCLRLFRYHAALLREQSCDDFFM